MGAVSVTAGLACADHIKLLLKSADILAVFLP